MAAYGCPLQENDLNTTRILDVVPSAEGADNRRKAGFSQFSFCQTDALVRPHSELTL